MNITNIIGKTGDRNPNREGDKKVLPLVLGFIAGLAKTACPALLPIVNDALLHQPAEFGPVPGAPVMPDGTTALV